MPDLCPSAGAMRAALVASLLCLTGASHGANWLVPDDAPSRVGAFGLRAPISQDDALKAHARALIELQTFLALPTETKNAIIMSGLVPELYERNERDDEVLALHGETPYESVAEVVSLSTFEKMRPAHRHMLRRVLETTKEHGPILHLCFTPGTPDDVVQAFEDAVFGIGGRFQLTGRWTSTAIAQPSYAQGEPVTLTYSFVPDGTFVPDLIGYQGNSNLFAFLNGIYGNPTVWQPIYDEMFARWAELGGLSYQYEPNDDGVALNNNPGVLGVRGDLRMAAIPLDGNSGVLAYNNFPNDGDMVLDSADNFYNNTTNNSLRLRNILSHEHGHGQGILHVCPREETKLMEPFISVMFDGPQFDDTLATQRHYGDRFENNDTVATSTDLGAFTGSTIGVDLLSIDNGADVDVFRISVSGPTAIAATAAPTQQAPYLQRSQNSGCTGGTLFDPRVIHDLKIDILASDGVTVLDTADFNGLGQNETAVAGLPGAGIYYVRVRGSGTNNIQLYSLSIESAPSLIRIVDAVEEFAQPGAPVEVALSVFSGADAVEASSVTLNYRLDGGAFAAIAMTPTGPATYTASIPGASCDDSPEFYFSALTSSNATLFDPPGGAGSPYSYLVGELDIAFDDDFETDQGWTVSGNATAGQWQRGVPVNGGRGDPATDFDGSGQCYVTGNTPGDSDVDNGSTILTSPVIDASTGGALTYAYWINSGPGVLDNDSLAVEFATDPAGTNWTQVRFFTTQSDNWRTDAITIGDSGEIPSTPTLRVRFIASDLSPASLLEAGIDAVRISTVSCTDVIDCPGDTNGDGVVNFSDLNTVLSAFGQTGQGLAGDVNDDGVVNFSDLNLVLSNFGASCR